MKKLLLLILIFASISVNAVKSGIYDANIVKAEPNETDILGDANDDKSVNVNDIATIATFILNGTADSWNQKNADVNCDGIINVNDITGVATIILGGGDEPIEDNTVKVSYDGTSAKVLVADNIKQYITVESNTSDVNITASADLKDKVTYILSGTTSEGSFTLTGSTKLALELNGVSITNSDGAAIDIECGKTIDVNLVKENYLTDGPGSQKACFYVKGHAEFSGDGVLNISGNSKHGFSSNEYTQLKSKFTGLIMVRAVGDGVHAGEYFKQNSGNLIISEVGGDAVQVELDDESEDADNGNIIIKGGSIIATTTKEDTDVLKADEKVSIQGGSLTLASYGGAIWDEEKLKVSGCACISCNTFEMTDGFVFITATGNGGKGISADSIVTINNGNLAITTYGEVHTDVEHDDDTKPQCIKADQSIYINGGNIQAFSMYGKGFSYDDETPKEFLINGGTVVAVGEKKSEPSGGTQAAYTYTKQKIVAGETYTFNNVTFTAPQGFNLDNGKVLVSAAE